MPESRRSPLTLMRRFLSFAVSALIILFLALYGRFQWTTYHQDLAVSNANVLPLPKFTPKDRILILSPHPDDETLGVGGLIAEAASSGIPVRVVFMTNGDGSLATRLVQGKRFAEQWIKGEDPEWPKNAYRQMAAMRQKEAIAAMGKLGVPRQQVVFLGYPDGGTKAMWQSNWRPNNLYTSPYTKVDHSPYANSWTANAPYCGSQVLDDLKQILVQFKPTQVFTTSPQDTHPDHWAAFSYLKAAMAQLQLQEKYFSWAKDIQCYTFLVHHSLWPVPYGYHPDASLTPPAALSKSHWFSLELSSRNQAAKTMALHSYISQVLTTPRYLRSFLRTNELLGATKTAQLSQREPDSWSTILQEPQRAFFIPQLIPGADIDAIEIKPTSSAFSIKMLLTKPPRQQFKYIVRIHEILPKKVTLNKIEIETDQNDQWKATLYSNRKDGRSKIQPLSVVATKNYFIVELPKKHFSKNVKESMYLLSASSQWGTYILDQSSSILFR